MLLSLLIPVKSNVYKFLLEKHGLNFRLNKKSHLGIALFNMLRRQSVDVQFDSLATGYTHQFPVKISNHSFFERGCRNITSETVVSFNSMVESQMEAELFGVIEFLEMFGVEQKQAIEVFMAKYSFDESDVKFESLKKAYQRYWNKKEKAGKKKYKGVDFLPLLFSLQTVKALGSRHLQKKVAKMSA